ncbi:unnamed protein product [Leptidea sinapis]|uniref:Cytochrome b5 heme-binding domain-containing protein n=1 Tax=Leptidea sinapis TaxID=189913 RepID=A0A5E4PRV6_9NEOP|nr:unnamed protein product [Leptidea sinapis]
MEEVKRYTRAEVAVNNGKGGKPVWLIYKDKVYDVTNYLVEHPGGDAVIMEEAGTDCTEAFDSEHSKEALTLLTKHKIGELVEEEKRYDENGKKKKRVISAAPDGPSRSCMSRITCGLIG